MTVPTQQPDTGTEAPWAVDGLVRRDPAGDVLADPAADITGTPIDLLRSGPRHRGSPWLRIASYLVTVFALLTLNFALPRMMPGDPIDALMIQGHPNYVQNDQTRQKLREYYGIDGSIPEQYVRYLGGLVRGDLGVSVSANRPVAPELFDAVPWTLLLIVTSTAVSIVIGIPAGIHSGWKRGKRTDRGLMAVFMAWQNIPLYVLGTLAFFVFAVELRLFPLGGGVTPLSEYTGFAEVVDIARHLALPALTMGAMAASGHYLLMRSSMVSELGADYLLGGRAKGLRERRLKYRYAGRNALLPVFTGIGLQVGMGITGVIFIERIFAYPGIGGYMFSAIGYRDYPALQGAFLLLTLSVVTVNLVVDLLYRRVDPRTAV